MHVCVCVRTCEHVCLYCSHKNLTVLFNDLFESLCIDVVIDVIKKILPYLHLCLIPLSLVVDKKQDIMKVVLFFYLTACVWILTC